MVKFNNAILHIKYTVLGLISDGVFFYLFLSNLRLTSYHFLSIIISMKGGSDMTIDGSKIVKYRAENHVTQAELAKQIGVKPLTIHRAEQGKCSKTTKVLIESIIKEEV